MAERLLEQRCASAVVVHDETVEPELDKAHLLERGGDRVQVVVEERHERVVGDVAGGDDEQSRWR